eukprot:TRINITY_DN11522_c0_g1_i1.p1 TRINITY_DN11522_c0_g1~~TRINITY_DN11522_c0_g1_i1.p1  ORF type:complete len:201 (+),score=38.92 TRINITY_DN11522_c0_g1_i1:37-639(+)
MEPATNKFKLVLLGEAGVGKSSIVLRLIKGEYLEFQHSTVGASFFRHSVACNGQTIQFDIWDTAGQERYKSLASMYYRGAAAALVVYEITSRESFERAKYWVRELTLNSSPNIVIALAGNKCDLQDQRRVPLEDALTYAAENNVLHLETSAKTAVNISEAFQEIAAKLCSLVTPPPPLASAPGGLTLNDGTGPQSRKSCC